jgi:hypothetical protein
MKYARAGLRDRRYRRIDERCVAALRKVWHDLEQGHRSNR